MSERRDPPPLVKLPAGISTGCRELDDLWSAFAGIIVDRPGIAIADCDDELNWHAFLGHSIDMQGFRAAEFAGVDPITRPAPRFVSLRSRGIGVVELASLWEVASIHDHLLHRVKGRPLADTLDVLRHDGGPIGASLAEAFEDFPYRKGHWSVRALLQNSASLKSCGYSFREWLRAECASLGVAEFPPPDFRRPVGTPAKPVTVELALRDRVEAAFYCVGPALASYILCDWQLWLWARGRTAVFANFKWDSFHEDFVRRHGRAVLPSDERSFARWWLGLYPELPPRLANECIWLGTEHGMV